MGRRQLSLLKKRENLPLLHLLFYLSPQWGGRGPPTIGKWMSLLIQMLILSRNTLTNKPRNNVSVIWASLSPINQHIKLTIASFLLELLSGCWRGSQWHLPGRNIWVDQWLFMKWECGYLRSSQEQTMASKDKTLPPAETVAPSKLIALEWTHLSVEKRRNPWIGCACV